MSDAVGGHRLLDPSELGTKSYWDDIYARELTNNEHDGDDEGTIWFEESGAEEAILRLLDNLAEEQRITKTVGAASATAPTRFLDLGTGNGHLLFALREDNDEDESWTGQLVGVDYSETSVELARRLAESRQTDNIRFEHWDLLTDPPGSWLQDGFGVVLDKGTFDAISLMPRSSDIATHPCAVYRDKVTPLIKPGHFLCITSCNWTKDELINWLAPESGELTFFEEAKYPSFTFGGQSGQCIVTLVFQRRAG